MRVKDSPRALESASPDSISSGKEHSEIYHDTFIYHKFWC